jgi:hypothetical protein
MLVNDSLAATSRAIGPLADNTVYFWRVRARNAAGESDWSTVFRFTTGTAPLPEVPALLLPAQFADSLPVTGITLSWAAAASATSYRVMLSASTSFSPALLDDSGLTSLSRVVPGTLLQGVHYYWKVSAKNGAGSSEFSIPFRFTTIPPVALLPQRIVLRTAGVGEGRALRFGLPADARVTVRVFDTNGNLVARLMDEPQKAGYHTIALPAHLRGGVYLVDFRAGNFRATMKTQP